MSDAARAAQGQHAGGDDSSWSGDVAGGAVRAMLSAQRQLVSSLGLRATGSLRLPRVPAGKVARGLEKASSVYDYATTVRQAGRSPETGQQPKFWAGLRAEYALKGLGGIATRIAPPLATQTLLGTVMFATYEQLLAELDAPHDENVVRAFSQASKQFVSSFTFCRLSIYAAPSACRSPARERNAF